MSIYTDGHEVDLTDQLGRLLIETAECFLRAMSHDHRRTGDAVEYEISIALRRRTPTS